MSDDLRDAIARALRHSDNSTYESMADAVLAMPEIVDMLALRRMCGDLTVEQVALALGYAAADQWGTCEWSADDDKAIAAWREPT